MSYENLPCFRARSFALRFSTLFVSCQKISVKNNGGYVLFVTILRCLSRSYLSADICSCFSPVFEFVTWAFLRKSNIKVFLMSKFVLHRHATCYFNIINFCLFKVYGTSTPVAYYYKAIFIWFRRMKIIFYHHKRTHSWKSKCKARCFQISNRVDCKFKGLFIGFRKVKYHEFYFMLSPANSWPRIGTFSILAHT